jgi:peptide/nickel transport system permease protein
MGTYILRRLLLAIPVLWGIATAVFFLVFAIPGDPADMLMGQHGDDEVKAAIHAKYHLDKPILVQYGYFMGRLVQFDLGRSYAQKRKVTDILLEHAGATIVLAVTSVAIAVVLGMGLGCLAAYRHGSWVDGAVMATSVLGISTPVFWLGLMAILLFCSVLRLVPFPDPEYITPKYLLLPALTLSALLVGYIARMTRSSLLEVIRQDYVRTARAKGLSKPTVFFKHGLRNALIPIVTVIGLNLASLMGGAIATETVFAWPGIGRAMFQAVLERDVPLIEGGVIMLALVFVIANIIVDVSYAFLDPRIRLK